MPECTCGQARTGDQDGLFYLATVAEDGVAQRTTSTLHL